MSSEDKTKSIESSVALVGTAIDHVTRRRLFYYSSDYTRSLARYTTFDATGSYQEYLHSLSSALENDITTHKEVFLFPLRIEEYENWAHGCGLEPDSVATREKYLASISTYEFHVVSDPAVLFALITNNIITTVGDATLREILTDVPEEETLSFTDTILDNAALAFSQITDFLEEAIVSKAIITYKATGFFDGNPAEVTGDLDMYISAGKLRARSPEHMTVLSSLVPLGIQHSADLTVRCFLDETDPRTGFPLKKLYGWRLSREGLSGMSAAEVFDAACTDPYGEPRPPEEGVTYAATDTFYA